MRTLLMAIILTISLNVINAQDQILKLNGETVTCKVLEITDGSIKYKHLGEDLLNNISKNLIEEIVFESGRVEKFNKRIVVNGKDDWEKVQITNLESDIQGLIRGEEMMAKAASGWSTTGQGKMQKKAIDKLKKQAAEKGYHVVLLITTTGKGGHFGISGGAKSSVIGVGYKYE
ncbi:hypothetical protein LCGC14_0771320 [marine sediment metagenome]|uniref:Uncharacterized protein n=1 Tax=marine sediment metagenome TaxID=412755 RepID=A0A0F9PYC6_9ZZZZ